MIQTSRAFFEQAGDEDGLVLLGDLSQRVGAGAGDRLGQLEKAMVFHLAEVLRAEHLLRADDVRAGLAGLVGQTHLVLQVDGRVGGARHLRQRDADGSCGGIGRLVATFAHVSCVQSLAAGAIDNLDSRRKYSLLYHAHNRPGGG